MRFIEAVIQRKMNKKCAFIVITSIVSMLVMTGCNSSTSEKSLFHQDHGKVTDLELSTPLYTSGSTLYDGDTIDSGDFHIKCEVIYEDGCREDTRDWTMEEPVTLDCTKENVITVSYGGIEKSITIGPTEGTKMYFSTGGNDSKLQNNTMLAETIIEQYPGHEREYYLDLLVGEGLSQNDAIDALNAAGY